jgi:hypothetical protein
MMKVLLIFYHITGAVMTGLTRIINSDAQCYENCEVGMLNIFHDNFYFNFAHKDIRFKDRKIVSVSMTFQRSRSGAVIRVSD